MPNQNWMHQLGEDVMSGKRKTLGEDDTFEFSCTACGKCCFGQDIMLNPADVYFMVNSKFAKSIGVETTTDLFQKELLSMHQGPSSKAPLCMIKLQEEGGPCPFLIPGIDIKDEATLKAIMKAADDGKDKVETLKDLGFTEFSRFLCGLHEDGSKPTVCKSSPIGRMYSPEGIRYIVEPPHPECPGIKKKEKHVVGEWIRGMKLEGQYKHSPWFFDMIADAQSILAGMDHMMINMLGRQLYDPDGIAMASGVDRFHVPSKIYTLDEYIESIRMHVESVFGLCLKFETMSAESLMRDSSFLK